jgi:hypothetical protein
MSYVKANTDDLPFHKVPRGWFWVLISNKVGGTATSWAVRHIDYIVFVRHVSLETMKCVWAIINYGKMGSDERNEGSLF